MRIAIVYDRVNKWGGAERVLLALHEMFPNAPLYTSVYSKNSAKWAEVFPSVIPSFLQKSSLLQTRHELIAPLMPLVFESFNFSDYDLIISVTSEAAKGIITKPETKHICYMLTPTRYLWSGYDEYFKSGLVKFMSKPIVIYLRHWDKIAAQRPDKIIAISTEVQKRIKKFYQRNSEIVYPPVDVSKFQESDSKDDPSEIISKDYFIIVSRLVGYKKVDLVIETFNQTDEKLVIVGSGNEERRLRNLAGRNITFFGNVDDNKLGSIYKNARAFLFPQNEDFGITAVEAQFFGTPVIAYNRGGALDTVIENETGILFGKQEVDSLAEAILRFKKTKFRKDSIIKNAERFSKERFKKDFMSKVIKIN